MLSIVLRCWHYWQFLGFSYSSQWHHDSAIRTVLSGRPTFKKIVVNHLCLSFFQLIWKKVSSFYVVFADLFTCSNKVSVIGTVTPGQQHQKGDITIVTWGFWLSKMIIFISYHICLSFFPLIWKRVSFWYFSCSKFYIQQWNFGGIVRTATWGRQV